MLTFQPACQSVSREDLTALNDQLRHYPLQSVELVTLFVLSTDDAGDAPLALTRTLREAQAIAATLPPDGRHVCISRLPALCLSYGWQHLIVGLGYDGDFSAYLPPQTTVTDNVVHLSQFRSAERFLKSRRFSSLAPFLSALLSEREVVFSPVALSPAHLSWGGWYDDIPMRYHALTTRGDLTWRAFDGLLPYQQFALPFADRVLAEFDRMTGASNRQGQRD